MPERCDWCESHPDYICYHDEEWGVPERDSRALFENLTLEGFQSGLSWITILKKRAGFRRAFAGFDPDILATWGEAQVTELLQDEGIVRHRGKIEATLKNARAFQEVEARDGFSNFIWRYVDGVPLQPRRTALSDVPGKTELSREISEDLKKAGFGFCGPTTVYAFMQASGLVNDHIVTCHRFEPLSGG
ncbi:MAG: DNA-3-methyladenine glycosylase I [Pseudomonadota bacterium]